MRGLARAEFAAERRTVLQDAEDALRPVIEQALENYGEDGWYQPIVDEAARLFDRVYRSENDGPLAEKDRDAFLSKLAVSLAKTKTPGDKTADRLAQVVGVATVNSATEQAGLDDPEPLSYEWVTMHDGQVRASHREVDGTVRAEGDTFHVGASELRFPGDPDGADPEDWLGCRCVLRPTSDRPSTASLTAAADGVDVNKVSVIVALPVATDQVHDIGEEQSHCTLIFLGDTQGYDPEPIVEQMNQVAAKWQHADGSNNAYATVAGHGQLGGDAAKVLLLNSECLTAIRNDLLDQPDIMRVNDENETYPNWLSHLTVGYGDDYEMPEPGQKLTFDRLALWHGDQQTERFLGENMTASADAPPEAEVDDSTPPDAIEPSRGTPWYGVLTIEGNGDEAYSGDGRRFGADSLRNRDLPLRLTWQRASAEGHDGSVVVGLIGAISRMASETEGVNEIRATGHFIDSPETDEVVGQAAEFGNLGVSVDIDDHTYEFSGEEEADGGAPKVTMTDARICSASIVTIPAFAQAVIYLGNAPDGYMGEPDEVAEPDAVQAEEEALVASAFAAEVDLTPSEGMRSACSRALEWIKDGKAGSGFESATADRARKIANGDSLTPDHVKRMNSYFSRHQGDKDASGWTSGSDGYPSAGRVAWDAWGGDAGASWSASKVSALDNASAAAAEAFGRGPGWVTDPVPTGRIHAYWTEPGKPGYAKIGWGTGGDFNRCRVEVGKYLSESGDSRYINQTCAQWHHDALGYWPATHKKMLGAGLEGAPRMVNIIASAFSDDYLPPRGWFDDPQLQELTAMTFVEHDSGMIQVFGHCAGWDQCHVGFGKECVTPIDSPTDYAYFNVSPRPTTDGLVYTGNISVGGGHADINLNPRAALAHYDDSGTTVADVRVGRDEFGIWFAGWVRPTAVSDQAKLAELYGCKLSGDWRQGELRHILGVNEGGFQVPRAPLDRVKVAVKNSQVSLVASSGFIDEPANVIRKGSSEVTHGGETTTFGRSQNELQEMVAAGIREYEQGKQRGERLKEIADRTGTSRAARMDSIRTKHQGQRS